MRTMKRNLLMVIVAVAFGLLATVLTPVYAVDKETAGIAKAKADIMQLKSALDRFRADTAAWPNRIDGSDTTTATAEVLYSEGAMISSANTWPVDNPEVYKEFVSYSGVGNDRNYPNWKGPYLLKTNHDPWGNTYLVGVKNSEKQNLPVWIISAGPDGVLQTPIDSPVCMDGTNRDPGTGLAAVGDDICLKYK